MEKYIIIIEKADDNYSAFSPDISGCITVGKTINDTIEYMKEAKELYLEEIAAENNKPPQSKGLHYYVEQGIFKDKEIADEYYIGYVEVPSPKIAV